jgi:hypothetical protein
MTSAARRPAGETTSVCGVPFCSEESARLAPFGLKAFKKSGSFSSVLEEVNDDVSRKAESDLNQ